MATDDEFVDQVDRVKAEMFKLEQMTSADIDNPQRRALFHVRVDFVRESFAIVGRRTEATKAKGGGG